MSDPYLGQIILGAITFAPRGYSFCNGASLTVMQNQALFSLIGTTYGGSGTNFNLPNLSGRTPVGFGATTVTPSTLTHYSIGVSGGVESVALSSTQMPVHSHRVHAGTATSTAVLPSLVPGSVIVKSSKASLNAYAPPSNPLIAMASKVGQDGGGQAHNNLQPFLAINFFIALSGFYPMRD